MFCFTKHGASFIFFVCVNIFIVLGNLNVRLLIHFVRFREICINKLFRKLLLGFFIVASCILTKLMFLSPTNALLYYTYKMLKHTVKISNDRSYMFRSIWTIIREPMPNLAKVTILCRYSVKIRR